MSRKIDVQTETPGQDRISALGSVDNRPQTVIVLLPYYLPGFKAGGPIRSVANLVDVLGQELKFRVVTSDRDIKDPLPYHGIKTNRWVRVGNADVMYLSPGWHGLWKVISLLLSAGPRDVLYLNSFFSKRFSIFPVLLKRMGFIKPQRIVLAPKGEFSEAALRLKNRKKTCYLKLAGLLKAYRGVVFHASSDYEARDIMRVFYEERRGQVANVLPPTRRTSVRSERDSILSSIAIAEDIARPKAAVGSTRKTKDRGHLQIVFVSRISPMKNLLGALRMLNGIDGDVVFDIYGPAEDERYWGECKDAIAKLPSNIDVGYYGVIEPDRVSEVFAESHLFFLPTLGENYGHVICEALLAGCPVLISDRTPWRNLEENLAGWDVPIEDPTRFKAILKECVNGDEARQTTLSIGAQNYALERLRSPELLEANRRLFHRADIDCS